MSNPPAATDLDHRARLNQIGRLFEKHPRHYLLVTMPSPVPGGDPEPHVAGCATLPNGRRRKSPFTVTVVPAPGVTVAELNGINAVGGAFAEAQARQSWINCPAVGLRFTIVVG